MCALRIQARPAEVGPLIEVTYNFTATDRPKILYLSLQQARSLYLALDDAIEALIRRPID
jgi:hypothetical protein